MYEAAVIQLDSGASRQDNLSKVTDAVCRAAEHGAKLAVLPETVDYIGAQMASHAWEAQEASQFFGTLAKECGIYLHCGSITKQPDEAAKPSNMTLFCGPQGDCICTYSKIHMFDVEVLNGPSCRESDEMQAGSQLVTVNTPLGKLGFAICYDIRFGEMFRLMALDGAQVICVCANFTMDTGKDHWEALLRTRAIENGCYVLASNQVGRKPAFSAYGNSMIIDPWGTVIARAGNREDIIYADIDVDYVNQVRREVPVLSNIRDDVYRLEGKQCADVLLNKC